MKTEKLASQLRCPTGEKGLETAKMMNETNIGMTRACTEALELKRNDKLLEIGHGNAAHLQKIFTIEENITYFGLDISELMHREAKKINAEFIRSKQAGFYCYEGKKIPFPDRAFDKIMTVNTLYFWEEPLDFLNEISRVLKKGGFLGIAFGEKKFMEQLPFAQFGFELYDSGMLEKLVGETCFKIKNNISLTENVKSKTGEWVEREFRVVLLEKH